MKIILYILTGVVGIFFLVLAAGIYRFNFTNGGDIIPGVNAPDPSVSTFIIRGSAYTLSSGSAKKDGVTVRLFGAPSIGDLDGGSDFDAAVLLEETSSDGVRSYFAALVLSEEGSSKTTGTVYLGADVSPQTVEIHEGKALYNFTQGGDGSAENPRVGKSMWFYYNPVTGDVGEWVKDFEGEAAAERKY